MPPNDGTLMIEDAELLPGSFKNFSGREGQYNREGDRSFTLRLNEPLALQLIQDGWNVKRLKDRETGEPNMGDYTLNVAVGYKFRTPLLVLISSKGRVNLSEQECDILDYVDIKKADVIIRPYHWRAQGKNGIKAYVKSLFITLQEDYLELKYADVPMAQLDSGQPKAVGSATQILQIETGANQQDPGSFEDAMAEEDIVDAELVD